MLRVSQTAKGRLRAHVFRVKVKRKGLNMAASQFQLKMSTQQCSVDIFSCLRTFLLDFDPENQNDVHRILKRNKNKQIMRNKESTFNKTEQ